MKQKRKTSAGPAVRALTKISLETMQRVRVIVEGRTLQGDTTEIGCSTDDWADGQCFVRKNGGVWTAVLLSESVREFKRMVFHLNGTEISWDAEAFVEWLNDVEKHVKNPMHGPGRKAEFSQVRKERSVR